MSEVLYGHSGCGRCADLKAGWYLTGGDSRFYDKLKEHMQDHEYAPSMYPDVTAIGERWLRENPQPATP